jgi:hypothetical protein
MARVKKELWLVQNDHYLDKPNGTPVPHLEFVDPKDPPDGEVLRKDGATATLEDLVGLCDQDAESVNAHDYCGAHRLLAAVLYKELGRKKATKIMLEIAQRRGLHGMAGMVGLPDSFKELGVGQLGHSWGGKFGD